MSAAKERTSIAHRFPLKDVARQAGVGLATVDRMLNGRGGVSAATERRIAQAIEELARQTLETTQAGRRFVVDLVMDAPDRFSGAVRTALEAELPSLLPAAFRVRAHLSEMATPAELASLLARIGRRGSHGVILKAPDLPVIAASVQALAAQRIPTVTLVTDIACVRVAHVGLDNRAAGETAAYLVASWMGPSAGRVLAISSSHLFQGEEQREAGFRQSLARLAPAIAVEARSETRGIERATFAHVRAALQAAPDLEAVYSIGGGNRAILEAFREVGRRCRVFVGHDLDAGNRRLLAEGAIDVVLHHDLRRDMRLACQAILQAQRVLPRGPAPLLSSPAIVTRFNMPPEA